MRRCLLIVLAGVLCAHAAYASSYVMMADEDLVDSASLVVRGRIASRTVLATAGGPATEYLLDAAQVLKGRADGPIRVRVPGGLTAEGMSLHLYGVPDLAAGEEVILLLAPRADGTWAPLQLMLGMFRVADSGDGKIAYRDLTEAASVDLGDADRRQRRTSLARAHLPRDADAFARWIGERASGAVREPDYWLPEQPRPVIAPFTLFESGGRNMHWSEFAGESGSVSWRMHRKGQAGLLGKGESAFKAALAAWTKAVRSIKLAYGGKRRARAGFTRFDGINAILFNDPNNEIAGSFSCTTGGVLAIGGPWFNGSVLHDGFIKIQGGDVVMQNGIGCALGRRAGRGPTEEANVTEVIGHELGHALGIGHSCGDTNSGACNTPRKNNALMRAIVHFDVRGARITRDDKAATRALGYKR